MNKVLITATVKLVSDSKKDAEAIKSLLSEQFLSKYEQGIVQVTVEPIKEIDEEGVWL